MKTIKLIRAIIVAIISCVNFSNCSSNPIVPEITVEMGNENYFTKNMDFDSSVGEKTFSFNSNVDWTIDVAATRNGTTWCTVTPNSGKAGANTIRIKVQENTSYDDRSVALTLTAGSSLTKTITITQKQTNALLLTTNKFEVDPKGGKINVEVKSNIEYDVIIPEIYKSWISQSSSSRGLSTSNLSFDIQETEEIDKREGEIIIKSGELSETIHIYQTGQNILLLSKNQYPVTDKGETIAVEIKSNFSFNVQMPDVDWIKEDTESRGLSSHTLYYRILPNESYDNRSAEIIYYDNNSDIKDTLKVIQAQKDAIILSIKEYNVTSEGGTFEAEINSNIHYEVYENYEWIKLLESKSRGLTKNKIQFEIAKNNSTNSRIGKISIKNSEKLMVETLTIIQNGNIPSIKVENAGTLSNLISDDEKNSLRSLKLSGNLNGSDIRLIRDMTGVAADGSKTKGKLNYLDLTDANIVEGGDFYSYRNRTKNDEISSEMFSLCYQLKTIKLPLTITRIGAYAFNHCSKLTSISIPDGIKIIGDYAFYGCSSLSFIKIPDNIEILGAKVFAECKSLLEIYIPKNIEIFCENNIYDSSNPFVGCTNLKKIDVDINNQSFSSVDGVLYNKDLTELIAYPLGKQKIEISNKTTTIKPWAFCENKSLISITLPEKVTRIENSAFFMCNNLERIVFPNDLLKIEDSAFRGCYRLDSINIPSKVEYINNNAFDNCKNMKTISADPNNQNFTSYDGIIYDKDLNILLICPEGKDSVNIYNKTKVIGKSAFSYCQNIPKISIPSSIETIEPAAFINCHSLESIEMSENVTTIKEATFQSCTSLKSFIISDKVSKIENYAFALCTNLEELMVFHKNPIEIKEKCFLDVNMNKCILYVPKGSENNYKSAKYWSNFSHIKPIE